MERIASATFRPWETKTSTCRSLATISSAVCFFRLITTSSTWLKAIPQGGPLFRGQAIIGNALTLPLVSLAVMPSAVIGILAYPFALDLPIWWMMGLVVRGMLTISTWISGFGQANVVVPASVPADGAARDGLASRHATGVAVALAGKRPDRPGARF